MEHVERMSDAGEGNYIRLGVELLVDFAIMYLVMYSMIATLDHFYLNINNLYMTLMMVTPMAVVMLVSMRQMFRARVLNVTIAVFAAGLFLAALLGMRTQALVGDKEFLRSMIPHHSGAILMCREANINDPEIRALCMGIIEGQTREIQQMQAILAR
jgi:hypothetical protein